MARKTLSGLTHTEPPSDLLKSLQRQMRGESIVQRGSMRLDPETAELVVPLVSGSGGKTTEVPVSTIEPIVRAVVDLLTPYIDAMVKASTDHLAPLRADIDGVKRRLDGLEQAVMGLGETDRNLNRQVGAVARDVMEIAAKVKGLRTYTAPSASTRRKFRDD